MVKAKSPIVLALDRKTARLLAAVCGSLVTNTGVGHQLAPICDALEKCDIYVDGHDWDLTFRVADDGSLVIAKQHTD